MDDEGPDLVLLTVLVVGVIALLAVGGQILRPGTAIRDTSTVAVSVAAAYLGGVLAFLSPCSVAVVPGILTYGLDTRGSLLRQTYVFYLGLSLIFVPLGFGLSLAGQFLKTHQILLTAAAGGAMILLGALILLNVDPFGGLKRFSPTLDEDASRTGRTFTLGAFFGFATSSCTAPIIAAIGVLSIGAGLAPLQAMLLFLVFALGIVTPLFPLAWAGEDADLLDRLQRSTWEVGSWSIPAAKGLAGVSLVGIGVLFIATNGTRSLTWIYDAIGATSLYYRLDAAIREALAGWPGWIATAVGAIVVGVAVWRHRRAPPPEGSP